MGDIRPLVPDSIKTSVSALKVKSGESVGLSSAYIILLAVDMLMRRRRLLTVVSGTLFLAGCSEGEPENGTPEEETPDERVEIVSHALVRDDEGTEDERVAIEGEVRIREEGLEHVELEARFFDEGEQLLDVTNERLKELDVGVQEFEIEYPYFGERARAVDGYAIEVSSIIEL